MLNSKNERELAYIVRVNSITAMDADRLECAHINGWQCVVGKGEFQEGDFAIYFEIDSQLPDKAPFSEMEFLRSKKFKVKTQKIRGVISQGLLVPLSAFEMEVRQGKKMDHQHTTYFYVVDKDGKTYGVDDDTRFMTKRLGVIYAVAEDNARKAPSVDKYKVMAQRRPKIFSKPFARWMMRREWGKRVMFLFFGRKKDKKNGWPRWVKKTDEDRVQNLPWLFPNNEEKWIATEKIDGTSTTFTMYGYGRKRQFLVCSRNVCFDKPDKNCFYDSNVYLEMAEKYHVEAKLVRMMELYDDVKFITLQGETYGNGIQNRTYELKDHRIAIFNVIFGYKNGEVKRLNPIECENVCWMIGLPSVPIIYRNFQLPRSCEELLEVADGKSVLDGGMREGLVFRTYDGVKSFKAVSNKFLLKYHG